MLAMIQNESAPSPAQRTAPEEHWPPGRPRDRWTVSAVVATAALLLLAVSAPLLWIERTAPPAAQEPSTPAPVSLYATGEDGTLRRLDPATLVALPPPRFGIATPAINGEGREVLSRAWLASADGSIFLQIVAFSSAVGNDDGTRVTVVDAATGRERHRFEVPFVFDPATARLSADGERLVAVETIDPGRLGSTATENALPTSRWHAFDTATGRLLATIEPPEAEAFLRFAASNWQSWTVDADGERLYRLASGAAAAVTGNAPAPVGVVAYDLATGAETGRLELPNTEARFRPVNEDEVELDPDGGDLAARGGATGEFLLPTLALSPNGSQLAVVDGTGSHLILCDSERLTVERTIELDPALATPAASYADPSAAASNDPAGILWFPAFTSDGRRLYLAGFGVAPSDGSGQEVANYGLSLIDLDSGQRIEHTAEHYLYRLWPAPDGLSLYAAGFAPPDPGSDPGIVSPVLVRLDAETLQSLAESEPPEGPLSVVQRDH